MNENAKVSLVQVEVCLALFKAVSAAKKDAVARRDEMCVSADVWGILLDAHAEVAEQWDW